VRYGTIVFSACLSIGILTAYSFGHHGYPPKTDPPAPLNPALRQTPDIEHRPARCDSNPIIPDVREALFRICSHGEYMGAWDHNLVPSPWYTASIFNKLGFRNHMQGIQRLRNSNFLVLSGSNTNVPVANLFIIEIASRSKNGDWTSNLILDNRPPQQDAFIRAIDVDSTLWHAGGISAMGDILAVPIFGYKPLHGKIIFYNMQNPLAPQLLPVAIDRPGSKAYAVALARLANHRIAVAVLSDRDHRPRRLDFYISRSTTFGDGFNPQPLTWFASDAQAGNGQKAKFSDYQSIYLLRQKDGRLFLLGFHNTIPSIRILPGKDYADLFEVQLPGPFANGGSPAAQKAVLIKIAHRQFFCKDGYCNMDAAAGLYIHPSGRLSLYAATFWIDENMLKFTSFPAKPRLASPIESIDAAWIDLFEHVHFKGRRLSIRAAEATDLHNYAGVFGQGKRFNNKISSARFQLPRGWIYRLYEHSEFQGEHIDLVGSGRVDSLANFKKWRFNDRVSSSRLLRAPARQDTAWTP